MTNNLKNEKGGKYPQKFYEKLKKASLNTDAISSMVLQDKKIAEIIINIVKDATSPDKTKSSDIKLSTSEIQYSLKNWNNGRNIIGDFKGFCPEENTIYGIEPQCYKQKGIYRRNRYYGSMLDTSILKAGQDFSELPNRCIIVLTEKDFTSKDPMIQHIKKVDLMSGNVINSGEEEIIVNLAAVTDDSELGQFIRDWTNPNPDNIKNPTLAEALRYYKSNPKGVHKMYAMLEDARKDAKFESDLKYIKLLLDDNWSMDKIKSKTKLDDDYLEEIVSTINSERESN